MISALDIGLVMDAPLGMVVPIGPMRALVIVRRIAAQSEAIAATGKRVLKDVTDHCPGIEVLRKRAACHRQ